MINSTKKYDDIIIIIINHITINVWKRSQRFIWMLLPNRPYIRREIQHNKTKRWNPFRTSKENKIQRQLCLFSFTKYIIK